MNSQLDAVGALYWGWGRFAPCYSIACAPSTCEGVNRHCIANIYRKAISCIDNSHREEFVSSSGGTLFLQLKMYSCVLSWSSPLLLQAEPIPCTINACIYIPRSCPLSFDDMKVRGEQVSLVDWYNLHSSSQGPF